MPVLKGAVTFARFRAERTKEEPKDLRRSLSNALRKSAFEPLDPTSDEDRAAGWVELEDTESTELAPGRFMFGDYLMASWRVDTLRVPAPRLKAELEQWTRAHEAQHGEPPKRAAKKAQKELILKKLRRQAFPASRTYDVTWNLETDVIFVWASGRKIVDEIVVALEEGFGLRLHAQSPGALVERAEISKDNIEPTPELFGQDVVSEARSRVGA
jgi:recombination associated protein RdgC